MSAGFDEFSLSLLDTISRFVEGSNLRWPVTCTLRARNKSVLTVKVNAEFKMDVVRRLDFIGLKVYPAQCEIVDADGRRERFTAVHGGT